MKTILSFLLFISISISGIAATIYVNINASGNNDGSSWNDAFTDLQDAIALSTFGDDIWVAQGTYKTTSGTSRTIYFVVKNGTKLYGGFLGTETTLSQRDVEINETILSGEIGSGSANDNSYRVVSFSNVTNQTRLDGFTITGGYNNSSSGGGIRSSNSSPIIANCTFTGNYATEGGGAINHSNSGILTIEKCVFDGNIGNTYGGGALRLYAGPVNITDCYFKSNQSNTYGGAIFIYGATVNIDRCVFAGNTCQSTGSAIDVADVGTLHLSNSLVVGNHTTERTAIYASTFSNSSAHTITNCTIAHNKNENNMNASYPSTVALNDEATISNSIIYGNESQIQVLGTGVNFYNSITENSANNASGTNVSFVDPQFISPGMGVSAPFDTTGYNYQLDILSPGIDAGSNTFALGTLDLLENTRIINSIVDIGAYEGSFCNSTSDFTNPAPYAICGGNSIELSVYNASSLIWSNGSLDDTLIVNIGGNYSVTFEDSNGCRGHLTATVAVSSNPTPNIAFSDGALNTVTYNTYQWSFNGAEISGATNSSHTPIEGYGEYQVEVTNNNGCSGSETFCLSPAMLNTDGPTIFCQGETVTLSVSEGDSYVWSTGTLGSSISVNSTGNYSVTVLNSDAGCTVLLEQSVTVNPLPSPSISISGDNLTTESFSSYQWNYNGSPISGAESQNIDPTNTGNGQYSVTVTNAQGCEETSEIFNLSNLSSDELDFSNTRVFPNPINAGSMLTVKLNGNASRFNLHNSLGELVLEQELINSVNQILIPELEHGVYFIDLIDNQTSINRFRIIIK